MWNEPVLENRCGVQEVQLKNVDDYVNDYVNLLYKNTIQEDMKCTKMRKTIAPRRF